MSVSTGTKLNIVILLGGLLALALYFPSSPSAASSTVKPSSLRRAATLSLRAASSSTTRTRMASDKLAGISVDTHGADAT